MGPALLLSRAKVWVDAIDALVSNVVTVLLSVLISVGCLVAGAWGPAAGAIGVAGFALWRWTVHAKNMIWVAATVGASSTLSMGAATGSMFLGIFGVVLTIASIGYGFFPALSARR